MLSRKVKRSSDVSCESSDGPKSAKVLKAVRKNAKVRKSGKNISKKDHQENKTDEIQSNSSASTTNPDPSDVRSSTRNRNRIESKYTTKKPSPESEKVTSASKLGEASHSSNKRLSKDFYEQTCEDLAKALLGKALVRMDGGTRLTGRIVETECYLGRRDKAAHSYKGQTDRNKAMFMDPGTAYVYNIYGMYCCVNISSQGDGEAVLIRSLEPLEGKAVMEAVRIGHRKKDTGKPMKERDLCNGPSKLTQALKINKVLVDRVDLTQNDLVWVEDGEEVLETATVVSKRINIDYAEEWTDKLLRFYEFGNPCVSVRDKQAEKQMEGNAR